MTDFTSQFIDCLYEGADKTTPKARVYKPKRKVFTEDLDFDYYFDQLVSGEFKTPEIKEQKIDDVIVEMFEESVLEPVIEEKPKSLTKEYSSVEFESFFDDLVEESFGDVRKKDLPEPAVFEDVVQTPEQPVMGMMDDLTNKLSTYLTRTGTKHKEPDPQDLQVVVENLQRQIQDVRRLVMESTVVSGIGQGGDGQGPGSGEVWFKRLDDVDMNDLQDGDTIIWDGEEGKWRPSSACYSIDGGKTTTVYENYLSGGDVHGYFIDGETDGGSATPGPCP